MSYRSYHTELYRVSEHDTSEGDPSRPALGSESRALLAVARIVGAPICALAKV